MISQVIAKAQGFPMLTKRRGCFNHVYMVSTDSRAIPFDEPDVIGRNVIAERRTPKIVVTLRFENRHDSRFGCFEICDFDEHIHNWFGGHPRNGSAAKVLDAPKKVMRETRPKMPAFLLEEFRPPWIVASYRDLFLNSPTD